MGLKNRREDVKKRFQIDVSPGGGGKLPGWLYIFWARLGERKKARLGGFLVHES